MSDEMAMIERRRIEAEILKPIYEELVERVGEAEAADVIGTAVKKAAVAAAAEFAAKEEKGTDLRTFQDIGRLWMKGGALEKEFLKKTDDEYHFNVTRCRYAEMYKEMGLGHIGHLLSCNRDMVFCEGYDPRIKLERTQTIMSGASHCDFRYRFEDGEKAKG
jgi:hypothetical protein